uniref:Uncharacterized protein n=1 Tax=Cucumis melo TaxID=3656 RepID=A0A9I9EA84_CUCME
MIWALTKNDVCFITKCSPDDPHRHPRHSGQLPTTVPFRLTAAMLLLPNSPAKQHRPISESLLSSLSVIKQEILEEQNLRELNLQWEEIRYEAHKQQQLASLE